MVDLNDSDEQSSSTCDATVPPRRHRHLVMRLGLGVVVLTAVAVIAVVRHTGTDPDPAAEAPIVAAERSTPLLRTWEFDMAPGEGTWATIRSTAPDRIAVITHPARGYWELVTSGTAPADFHATVTLLDVTDGTALWESDPLAGLDVGGARLDVSLFALGESGDVGVAIEYSEEQAEGADAPQRSWLRILSKEDGSVRSTLELPERSIEAVSDGSTVVVGAYSELMSELTITSLDAANLTTPPPWSIAARDGARNLWFDTAPGKPAALLEPDPLTDGRLVISDDDRDAVEVLDLTTGTVVASTEPGERLLPVAGGFLLVESDDDIEHAMMLDRDGETTWDTQVTATSFDAFDGQVFATVTTKEGNDALLVYDPESGDPSWPAPVEVAGWPLGVVGDYVLVNDQRDLRWIDLETGQIRALTRDGLTGEYVVPCARDDQFLYLSVGDGIAAVPVDGPPAYALTVTYGAVELGEGGGRLLAFQNNEDVVRGVTHVTG